MVYSPFGNLSIPHDPGTPPKWYGLGHKPSQRKRRKLQRQNPNTTKWNKKR